ncbi:hypothetical protein CEQ90_04775 [Lewinellaceae bacterium SD302]|nr:hypothetical protein CEQ90_04775 [Lewinellaceae bacterium SD302]
MNTRYAISDIHGNYRTFLNALDTIQLSPSDELYLLGDYIDRGPGSREVISHIFQLIKEGYRVNCLRGNHEQYMLDAFATDDFSPQNYWLKTGGGQTLDSYRTSKTDLHPIVDDHLKWMNALPYYFDIGDYLLVHAGLNFKSPDPLQDKKGILFSRRWYGDIDPGWLGDRFVVHGHTPIERHLIEAQLSDDHPYPAFNIDAGCFHYRPGFGHLCVMNLDNRSFDFLANADMDILAIRQERLV